MSYPTDKKILCRIAPLRHMGLKRIPVQVYLGRILGPLAHSSDHYVFGTPHGLLFVAPVSCFEELSAEQYRELETLESEAITGKKILYGGEPGLREFTRSQRPAKNA